MQIRRWRSLNVIESGETKKKNGCNRQKKKKNAGKDKKNFSFCYTREEEDKQKIDFS